MNSIKTGVVVVVLLGVLYGVYKVLNVPEQPLTQEEQEAIKLAENLNIQTGTEFDPAMPSPGSPVAVEPYLPGTPSPAGPALGSGNHAPEFSVPQLTPDPQPSGSGNRNDYAMTGQQGSSMERPPTATDGHTSTAMKQSAIGANLPPLDQVVQNYERTDDNTSLYEQRADQTSGDTMGTGEGDSKRNDQDIAARVFDRAMFTAEELVARGNYRDALAELTKFYDAPSLSSDERQKLINWLDPLAGKVIYSSEHQLESPRIVRSGETLGDIAYEYGVPERLLLNINRNKINNPNVLRPGTELKVVRGPFEAHVSLGSGKLTLFLGELYAGHFPITLGRDPIAQPGTYYVKQIVQGREYVAADGRSTPVDSPDNPYGRWWIDLGSEMSIHGSAANGNVDGRGCISLSAVDIVDLSEILSRDSKVRIEE